MRVKQRGVVAQAFELRRATRADRATLAAMYRSFEPKAAAFILPPRDIPQRWLDSLRGYPNFIAVAQGRVVAHAVLCPEGSSAEVAIFVHQDFRGRGLGRRLLGELINDALRLGLRRLWAVIEPANVPMARLARSLGFAPGEELGEFYLDFEKPAEPAEEYIRRRAYEIYLARGRTPGQEVQDWLLAERELRSSSCLSRSANSSPRTPNRQQESELPGLFLSS